MVLRPKAAEGETGAAARLVDQRLLFHCLQNRTQGVLDRENEAGGQLLQRPSGIHERRRIGKEFQPGHGFVKVARRMRESGGTGIELLSLRDVCGDAPEQFRNGLSDRAVVILRQITSTKHQLRFC